VLGDRGVAQEVLDDAELVLSELVTNALCVPVPSDRRVGVRITHSVVEGLLRLEVSDAGGGRPEAGEPGVDETCGRGLLLVEALAHRWGYEERAAGIGKTVFAELKAPDLLAGPVACEQYAAADPVVVLTLDDGPAQRVHAVEPLSVRGGERAG